MNINTLDKQGSVQLLEKIQIQINYAQEKIVQKQNNQIREAYLINEIKD